MVFFLFLGGFSYASQSEWPGTCNAIGKRQSPIDVDTVSAVPSTSFRAFFTTGLFNGILEPLGGKGHTIEIKPENVPGPNPKSKIQNPNPNTLRFQKCPDGLAEFYRLKNIHIHWGKSEHTIDGEATFAEIHCVFSIETKGLPADRVFAVYGILLTDECKDPDPGITALLDKMLETNLPKPEEKNLFQTLDAEPEFVSQYRVKSIWVVSTRGSG